MSIKLIKENLIGKSYQADNFKIYYRNKDSISGDNNINPKEKIYLITGEAEITYKEETYIAIAPEKITFEENTYHKIKAITDITFLIFKE